VTGRAASFFTKDLQANAGNLRESISGSRVAVIGAAGSIGSSVVKTVLRFEPAAVSLIDLSENNLVEPDSMPGKESLKAFIHFCRQAKTDPRVTKEDYVRAMLKIVPTLQHVETGKNLDQKM